MLRALLRAALVAAALALAGGSTAAAAVLGEIARPAPVSAYAGTVAWSAFDPAAGVYRLTVSTRGAPGVPAPVAPRRVPFDVDLGPGPDGRVVAAYSRCEREPALERPTNVLPAWNTGAGCDLHLLDLAAGTERQLRGASTSQASEYLPTVWRDTVVFARRYGERAGARGLYPYLYARPLEGAGGSERLPGASRGIGHLHDADSRSERLRRTGQPVGIDLRGERVALSWYAYPGDPADPRDTNPRSELRTVTLGGDTTRLDFADAGLATAELMSPTQETSRRVFSGLARLGTRGQDLRRYAVSRPDEPARLPLGDERLVLAVSRDRALTGSRGTYALDAPFAVEYLGAARQCAGTVAATPGRCRIVGGP